MNVAAFARFLDLGEKYFLESVRGERDLQEPRLDCMGAHRRMFKAARSFARIIKPEAGFREVISPARVDAYIFYATVRCLGMYMSLYEPGYPDRKGEPVYSVALFESPLPKFGMELEAREGFVFLILDKRGAGKPRK